MRTSAEGVALGAVAPGAGAEGPCLWWGQLASAPRAWAGTVSSSAARRPAAFVLGLLGVMGLLLVRALRCACYPERPVGQPAVTHLLRGNRDIEVVRARARQRGPCLVDAVLH